MGADWLLRNHLFALVPFVAAKAAALPGVVRLRIDWRSVTFKFALLSGLTAGHRLVAYRALGMVLVLAAAAFAFWRLSKTEGRWLRGIAGVMILLAVAQLRGVAGTVISDCSIAMPYWLWVLAGCWYL